MKKKLLVMLLTFAVAFSVLVGCSSNEIGFYNLSKEISQMGTYEGTETLTLDVVAPELVSASVMDLLKDAKLNIKYQANIDKMEMAADISWTLAGQTTNFGKLYLVDSKIYMPIKGMKDLVAKYGSAEDIKDMNTSVGDNEWMVMDLAEIAMYGDLLKNPTAMYKDVYNFSDRIINEGYKNFTFKDAISKTSNGYQFKVTDANLLPYAKDFSLYTVNNIATIKTILMDFYKSDFAKSYMSSYLTSIGEMTGEKITYDEVIATLEQGFVELSKPEVQKQAVAEVEELFADVNSDFMKTIAGSYLTYDLSKPAMDNYGETIVVNFAFNDPAAPLNKMNFKLTADANYKKVSSVTIAAPKGKIVNIAEVFPETQEVYIFLDDNTYMMSTSGYKGFHTDFGDVSAFLQNDSTYLPLRQIGELFGSEVVWEQATQKAYVVVDGKKVEISGLLKNDTTFVKLREFEKVGYTIEWDAESNSITIVK